MPPSGEEYAISPQEDLYRYGREDSEVQNNYEIQNQKSHSPQIRPLPNQPHHVPFLERLRALPEIRPIPWRTGQELPPEKAINSSRVQQRGAILLSTRGKVMQMPCSHCSAGYGRFSQCITLDNWFQGACSTCIFTSKGNKCSLRFQTSGI